MHDHAALIQRFYEGFCRRDWAAMATCYHPEIHFTDPVFDLHGADAAMMWRMLCTNGRDLRLEYSGIQADDKRGCGPLGSALHLLGHGAQGAQHHRRPASSSATG